LSGRPKKTEASTDLPPNTISMALTFDNKSLYAAAYSGHSLRAGFLTSAAEAVASVFKMMEVSRHRSVDTLRGYVRRADLFHEHAGAAFL
jgi:hypothetical protein